MSNRKLRRAMERAAGKDNRIQQIKRQISNEVTDRVERRIDNGKVEVLFLCFALALHRELGLDRDRIWDVLQRTDELIIPWTEGEVEISDMQRELEENANLRIEV